MKKAIAIFAIIAMMVVMPMSSLAWSIQGIDPATYTSESSDVSAYVLPVDLTAAAAEGKNNFTSSKFATLTGYSPDEDDDEFVLQVYNGTAWVNCTQTIADKYINITAFGSVTSFTYNSSCSQFRYKVKTSDDDYTEVLGVNSTPSKTKPFYIITLPGTETIKIGDYYYKYEEASDDTNNVSVILADKTLKDLTANESDSQLGNYSSGTGIYTFNMSTGHSHQILVTGEKDPFSSKKSTATATWVDPLNDRWYFPILMTKSTATVTTEDLGTTTIYAASDMQFTVYEDYGSLVKYTARKVTVGFNSTSGCSLIKNSRFAKMSSTDVGANEFVIFDSVYFGTIETISSNYSKDYYGCIVSDGDAFVPTAIADKWFRGYQSSATPVALLTA